MQADTVEKEKFSRLKNYFINCIIGLLKKINFAKYEKGKRKFLRCPYNGIEKDTYKTRKNIKRNISWLFNFLPSLAILIIFCVLS